MTRIEVFYLLPYLASIGLSVRVLIYASERRSAEDAAAYTWYIGDKIFGSTVSSLKWRSRCGRKDLLGRLSMTGRLHYQSTDQWLAAFGLSAPDARTQDLKARYNLPATAKTRFQLKS